MSSSKVSLVFLLIIALLSLFLWESTILIASNFQLYTLLLVHILIIGFSLASIRYTILPKSYNQILIGLISISIFFVLFYIWNTLFRWYSETFDFKGNIFRGLFYGFRAPFYGRLKPAIDYSDYFPIYISTLLFIILVFRIKWKQYSKWTFPILMIMGAILFFTFSWDYSLHKTLMSKNCHYKTFSEGLAFFPDWNTFLSSYIGQMKHLGAHNNHYPPGVLLLLKINNSYFPYLFKLLVIAAPLLSLFPLKGILKHFSFSREDINVYIAFYISSIALLFFPGKSITPLHILFASTFIFFLLKSIESKRSYFGILAGLALSIYAFFSFSFLVFSVFCFIFLVFLLKNKQLKISELFKPSVYIIATFFSFYIAMDLLFDFNLYSCFYEAFSNEGSQMKSSGIDNLGRYLIVSSGNLIAYVGLFSPLLLGVYAERINRGALKKNTAFNQLIKAVILTIVILSFSSQFYLEVERIWIFLTPFVLFGFLFYSPISKVKNLNYLQIALSLNIIMALVFTIIIKDCT